MVIPPLTNGTLARSYLSTLYLYKLRSSVLTSSLILSVLCERLRVGIVSLWIMASGFVKAELSTCRHGRPKVTSRLLYKTVLLLIFGLILWKWMNGVDSLCLNQECRIGYKHPHSRDSQCLASIWKLGNRRSSEGLRGFKPSKGTNLFILIILAGDIEMNQGPRFQCGLCKKYCKASDKPLECEECVTKQFSVTVVICGSIMNAHSSQKLSMKLWAI